MTTTPKLQTIHFTPPSWFSLNNEDLFPHTDNNNKPNLPLLHKYLSEGGRLTPQQVGRIVKEATLLFCKDPNCLELYGSFVLVGDIHGNFYDIHELMKREFKGGNSHWVFLGDYVDRGVYGMEVILLLYAYKINFPKTVHLIRGNHECRIITAKFNFREECITKYDLSTYDQVMDSFDALPLAATLATDRGTYFAVHGGISPEADTIEAINSVDRFCEPDSSGPLCDLLWSDPLGEATSDGLDDSVMKEWWAVQFVDNPTRGVGQVYGFTAVNYFLCDNGLVGIIRAHETCNCGYTEHMFKKESRDFPYVVTIFSAPNYCGWYGNSGAIMFLDNDGHWYKQFNETPPPKILGTDLNALTFSVPLVTSLLSKLALAYLDLVLGTEKCTIPLRAARAARTRQLTPTLLRCKVPALDKAAISKISYLQAVSLGVQNELSPISPRSKAVCQSGAGTFWREGHRSNQRHIRHALHVGEEVKEAYDDVRNCDSGTNWVMFGYDDDWSDGHGDNLCVVCKGSDGLPGIIQALETKVKDKCAFCYFNIHTRPSNSITTTTTTTPGPKGIQVTSTTVSTVTSICSFVLLTWTPPASPIVKQAFVPLYKRFVKEELTEIAVEIDVKEVAQIKQDEILKKVEDVYAESRKDIDESLI